MEILDHLLSIQFTRHIIKDILGKLLSQGGNPGFVLGIGGLAWGSPLSHRKLVSTNKPVAFRSVHTGIEPPFLLKIYYAITACMTRGFTSRK